MLLMIDNYDSFTYNLVQYFGELGQDVHVYRNDKITIEEMEALRPQQLVFSPGPCTPNEAGISVDAIRHFAGRLPVLGVCLGHQSLAVAFGGEVVRADQLLTLRCSWGCGCTPRWRELAVLGSFHGCARSTMGSVGCVGVCQWTTTSCRTSAESTNRRWMAEKKDWTRFGGCWNRRPAPRWKRGMRAGSPAD